MEKNKNKPFLAYYAMTLVHDPFQPTPDSDDWDVDPNYVLMCKTNFLPTCVLIQTKWLEKYSKNSMT